MRATAEGAPRHRVYPSATALCESFLYAALRGLDPDLLEATGAA